MPNPTLPVMSLHTIAFAASNQLPLTLSIAISVRICTAAFAATALHSS